MISALKNKPIVKNNPFGCFFVDPFHKTHYTFNKYFYQKVTMNHTHSTHQLKHEPIEFVILLFTSVVAMYGFYTQPDNFIAPFLLFHFSIYYYYVGLYKHIALWFQKESAYYYNTTPISIPSFNVLVLLLAIGFYLILVWHWGLNLYTGVFGMLVFLNVPAHAFHRTLAIYSNGIATNSGFYPWKELHRYQWGPENPNHLKLWFKPNRFLIHGDRTVCFDIETHGKEKIDQCIEDLEWKRDVS